MLLILAILGILISIYSIYIERKHTKQKDYKALCDIRDNVSCSKSFNSKYAKIFFIPNSVIGLIFYIMIIVLIYLNYPKIIFYLSIISVLTSLYLAYISYFKLKNYCIVCNLSYIINILILIFSF